MIHLIDKFYAELQAKYLAKIDEMIGSLVISNNAKKLVDNWDDIMSYLVKMEDATNAILSNPEEEPASEDYVKMAALYILYAIMCKLDEKFEEDHEVLQ